MKCKSIHIPFKFTEQFDFYGEIHLLDGTHFMEKKFNLNIKF